MTTTAASGRADAVQRILTDAADWAGTRPDVVALVLVGSHARGEAREDSDVDVVVVAEDAQTLLDDTQWTRRFGLVQSLRRKDYGLVQSLIATYDTGLEIEWGLTDRRWLAADPVDPPTARVVAAGARVLYDPHGLASALVAAAVPS